MLLQLSAISLQISGVYPDTLNQCQFKYFNDHSCVTFGEIRQMMNNHSVLFFEGANCLFETPFSQFEQMFEFAGRNLDEPTLAKSLLDSLTLYEENETAFFDSVYKLNFPKIENITSQLLVPNTDFRVILDYLRSFTYQKPAYFLADTFLPEGAYRSKLRSLGIDYRDIAHGSYSTEATVFKAGFAAIGRDHYYGNQTLFFTCNQKLAQAALAEQIDVVLYQQNATFAKASSIFSSFCEKILDLFEKQMKLQKQKNVLKVSDLEVLKNFDFGAENLKFSTLSAEVQEQIQELILWLKQDLSVEVLNAIVKE